jgi:NADH-quinone oxidoreductase subunit N
MLGGAAAPVIVLGAGAVVLLLLDLLWEGAQGLLRAAALILLALGAVAAWGAGTAGPAFHGAIEGDALLRFSSLIAIAGAAAAVLLPQPSAWGRRWSAYLALLLWSAAGMALLSGAGNLIILFLGVEVLSLGLYALTALDVGSGRAAEAGLKYFVLGGLGSGLLLFGAALSYAATGSLSLGTLACGTGFGTACPAFVGVPGHAGAIHAVGALLVVAGLGFKLALVPFQLWTADVYEGAPTPVTAFMAIGTKAAAFAALARFLTSAFGVGAGWGAVVLVLGVASMFAGYLLALAQPGLKRLLAFSGIANAGTLVLALLAPQALRPVAFVYLAAYASATLGAFAVVSGLEAGPGGDRLAALRGLGRRSPFYAVLLVVCLLSLASVPPTGGFLGKLLLLQALAHAGYPVVAVLVVLSTLVALYPYFKLAVAVVSAPEDGLPDAPRPPLGVTVVAACAAAATLVVGIFPGTILRG